PMPEEHDGDEGRQLPPEVELEQPEGGRHRRPESDGDRHPDEEHHPRLARPDLGDRPPDEWRASIDEHGGAEHGRHPLGARELGSAVAEPLLDHVREEDDEQREGERQPEAVPEHGLAVAGVLIVAVRLALAVAVVVVGPGRAWIRTVVGMIGHTLLSAWAYPNPGSPTPIPAVSGGDRP